MICAGDLPELKHAQGAEGAKQSSAGMARNAQLGGSVCLATCAGAPLAMGTAGTLLGMLSTVPHCVNRNLIIFLNGPSSVSIPQGISKVRLFVVMFKEIASHPERQREQKNEWPEGLTYEKGLYG